MHLPALHGDWPWITLALLGAFHGINPGMGWLFAVSLGLQEKKRSAVLRALPPIALGHAASIAAVALLVIAARYVLPVAAVKWVFAAGLCGFGAYKLLRTRHPRWVGMRVGFRDLTAWSFLMASAHGAGLMLVPVLLEIGKPAAAAPALSRQAMANMPANCPMLAHPASAAVHAVPGVWSSLGAVGLHTLSHLLVAGVVAIVVYEKLGLSLLRKTWFNLDGLWAAALIAAGVVAALA
ncbi:hypothetical protein CCAX7_21760 [Capsulimonas corticalis]|uniref:Uncharacterized protein n=1 Tax=Capsulimonas corticalis TaxID=2219043 RepID=A0A402D226_9BACT|nr:hypothetical protein [Capsulimonas corticalis]BDI30125.1 hypothetical protein CCAX7_21760 [Capsulimonas corticalis]